jgi:hypothetical protein
MITESAVVARKDSYLNRIPALWRFINLRIV